MYQSVGLFVPGHLKRSSIHRFRKPHVACPNTIRRTSLILIYSMIQILLRMNVRRAIFRPPIALLHLALGRKRSLDNQSTHNSSPSYVALVETAFPL